MTEGNVRRYLFDVTLDEKTGEIYESFLKHFVSLKAKGVSKEEVEELIKSFNTSVVMGGLLQFYHTCRTEKKTTVKLVIVSGPMKSLEFPVNKSIITIGRHPGNDIFLPGDPTVSRRHARITYEDNQFWVEDTNSTNGTYIGEERITARASLPINTTFNVGPHTSLKLIGTKEMKFSAG